MPINKYFKRIFVAAGLLSLCAINPGQSTAAPVEDINPDSRCAVCGMFVAKYEVWITQVRMEDGSQHFFDGVKDMMAYYQHPEDFGGKSGATFSEVWVKDYYALKWLDGRKALYVVGSDVHGPMGHEFIPFSTKAAAEAFKKDHHGEKIYTFTDITPEIVEKMRSGMKMKN